jgi:putative tricarboxylic transport membrane protein
MRKYDFEPAPLVLAYVLGPMLEQALRRSLIMSKGDFSIFFTRPISVGCILVCAGLLSFSLLQYFRRKAILHRMARTVY